MSLHRDGLSADARAGGRWLAALAAAIVTCFLFAWAGDARAYGIDVFDGAVTANASGDAFTQAGGHPFDVSTDIDFTTRDVELLPGSGFFAPLPAGDPRTLKVDLPPGLVGNPEAVPACSLVDFYATTGTDCPPETQVGTSQIQLVGSEVFVPLYNVETGRSDIPAAFGFDVVNVRVLLNASVRSDGDYGITVTVPNVNQGLPILATRLTLWGVPAARSHDQFRCRAPTRVLGCEDNGTGTAPEPVNLDPRAFLTLPTVCTPAGVGLETRLTSDSWQAPGEYRHASFVSHLPPGYPAPPDAWGAPQGPEGCDRVPFEPTVDVKPTSTAASRPTGLDVTIDVPQDGLITPGGIASGHLKQAKVTLPEGMSISPSASDGLHACTDAQVGFGSLAAPACPDAAKVGTVTIETPVLARRLEGSVYIGEPKPGNIFRLVLYAEGAGVVIKLRGDVRPDPVTGRIVTTFDDNPQLPFSSLRLRLRGGPRAPLANPGTCGRHSSTAELTSWGGKSASSSSSFTLTHDGDGAPCATRGFSPTLSAGLVSPEAGGSSTFTLSFARNDDEQIFRSISLDMPEGLTGVVAGPELCAEAQAATGTCPESSRVGSTTTGAGPGTNPFHLPGRVYITGPYRGAPFGLAIVVPAIAGPFDLGTVVVRAGIRVDPRTTRLTVFSDPLPTILEGVPLLLRSVNVTIDRAGFMRAPTSCARRTVATRIESTQGGVAQLSQPFRATDCAALPFRPRLTFSIGDRRHVRGGSTAPMRVSLRMPRGAQANNQSIEVTLPNNLNSRLAALRGACSLEDAAARSCGRASVVGSAVATTPLLRDPVRGPVYIVRTPGNRLPNLWVALRGGAREPVDIDLIGRVRVIGRELLLRTTFGEIPDVPVSTFQLNLIAGRQGPIGLIRGICSRAVQREMIAKVAMRGHNGDFRRNSARMSVTGCARGRARRTGRSAARGTTR